MTENRRPLASRETHWARSLTRWLAATSITPNQISMVSMLMAALAGVAFYLAGGADGVLRVVLLVLAALFCQLRLLCNLLDGMLAIEAGKSAADGPFWNEFPDRVSDILIVVGLGYGVGHSTLGWAAASFCVLTAYVRELGRASGAPADFSGPMAKPHRMALITAAALVSCFDPLWNGQDRVLVAALWVVALGAAVTVLRRSANLVRYLRVHER
ncbi:MAG TPA: CDP-alcohol phosphatidyltransferase family protein [Mesorhizobium sp.]|nr:CDP-alcohol phosphatidyltransferase family protein [Mesorhizobium sp.]